VPLDIAERRPSKGYESVGSRPIRVFPLSAMKGSALTLKQIGCLLADNLSPQKARILLMLALTDTHAPETLQKYFDN